MRLLISLARIFFPYQAVTGLLLALTAAPVGSWAQGFDPAMQFPTVPGTRPYGLGLADINGDGLLDIVAGDNNATTRTTSVLVGQPGGTFGAVTAYPSVPGSWDLTVADVNQDGRPDLVTGCNGPAQAAVQLGQPGGFGALTSYQTGGGIIQNVAVGDMNSDGLPDIVLADLGNNSINVLEGQAGGFARSVRYYVGPNNDPFAVALGDLNGDGRLDIVIGNSKSGTIGVLLGQAGGFAPLVTYAAFRNGAAGINFYFIGVALADMDGDGWLDVVTTTEDALSGQTVGVLLGRPGGLGPITYYASAGLLSHSVAVGDVNGDGWPDIVLASSRANAVGLLLGYPGGFSTPFQYSTGANSAPYAVKLGDLNNDGRLDMVTTNSASSSVGVLLNSAPQPLAVSGAQPASAATGSTIALSGQHLQGAVAVVFSGTTNRTASSGFTVNAAGTQITGVVVPAGATSGPIQVVTPGSTVVSTTAFVVLSPTATAPAQPRPILVLYPNPARYNATLAVAPTASARAVALVDAQGRTVRQLQLPAQATTLPLQLEQLPAGLYLVRCSTAATRLMVE
ncbi:MAG: T9SS type A sorting domain-containing protein [Bacteroidota bacterium]|nr:T9SS type A sorting domain-containing protein [Bacteroidota bacterium]